MHGRTRLCIGLMHRLGYAPMAGTTASVTEGAEGAGGVPDAVVGAM